MAHYNIVLLTYLLTREHRSQHSASHKVDAARRRRVKNRIYRLKTARNRKWSHCFIITFQAMGISASRLRQLMLAAQEVTCCRTGSATDRTRRAMAECACENEAKSPTSAVVAASSCTAVQEQFASTRPGVTLYQSVSVI